MDIFSAFRIGRNFRAVMRAALTASVLSLVPVMVQATQYVVIRSSEPELARGSILSGGTKLSLSKGASVTLIDDGGKPLTIKGPFTGPINVDEKENNRAHGQGLLASLSRLVGSDERGRTSLGSIRGGEISGETQDPWAVNVARAGSYCLRKGIFPRLWRSKTNSRMRLVVLDQLFGIEKKVAWEKGQAYVGWPEGLEVHQGRVYMVQPQGKLIATRIDFRFLPDDVVTPGEEIVWMAENGCDVQAQLLVDSLK